ncbi:MAG: hypothetical protein B7Z77_03370 [Acidocella sp. 20-58-15]|nr:MAG: hypothetical protein B7Z77_03370 [Acidocella sp. 20-58-15]
MRCPVLVSPVPPMPPVSCGDIPVPPIPPVSCAMPVPPMPPVSCDCANAPLAPTTKHKAPTTR